MRGLFALLIVAIMSWSAPARAALTLVSVSGAGNHTISATWDGQCVLVDATAGNTVLLINDVSALGAGFHLPCIYKIDTSSNVVGIKIVKPGDHLNGWWAYDAPYPLWLNVSQAAGELVCDGVSNCYLMGKNFHRAIPQSQRTVRGCSNSSGCSTPGGTIAFLDSYNLRPQDAYEVVRVDATYGPVGIYVDPNTHWTRGGYLSAVVSVARSDATSNSVTVWPTGGHTWQDGATNKPVNGVGTWLCMYIASDTINVC